MRTFKQSTAAFFVLLTVTFAGAKTQVCILNITVTREVNGKQIPARNAAVILHGVSKSGKQQKSGMEIKTDAEGHTSYPGVPYGMIRVQVIMPHYQTFGQDYEVRQPDQSIEIKLKRPGTQYSIYDDKGTQAPSQKNASPPPPEQKPPAPKAPPK